MKKQITKIPKLKTRITWGFNPTTRVKPSNKVYNRKKLKTCMEKYRY